MTITKSNTITKVVNEAEAYNEVPYESESFYYTNPDFLKTIATIFGVNAPDLTNARILEIGCAGGLNLPILAQSYPNSYSLGIDISSNHIKQANEMATSLGLKNLEYKQLSITDLDESYGKFDYIISHGVFSWVPDEIREHILRVSKEFLTPNGIAFISYNTLPGWNMVNTIRDMKLFHSEIFTNIKDKLNQGKLFLKFISDAFEQSNTSYATFLKEEVAMLKNKDDSYIRHEYFAKDNKALYFHEFIKMAKNHGLTYLSEAIISNMYIGNMPVSMQKDLSTITDIIRLEQYMDFISNRRFRCTLLCHDDVVINRQINTDLLDKFLFTCRLSSYKNVDEIDFSNSDEEIHYYDANMKGTKSLLSTKFPATKVLLQVLGENIGNPLNKKEIIDLACKKYAQIDKEIYENEFNNSMLSLMFSNFIQFFAVKPKFKYSISKKPKVNDLTIFRAQKARLLGKESFNVTNQINEAFGCSAYQIDIIVNLNGKKTIEEIKDIFLQCIKDGKVSAKDSEGNAITDENSLKNIAHSAVDNLLEFFKRFYLLIG